MLENNTDAYKYQVLRFELTNLKYKIVSIETEQNDIKFALKDGKDIDIDKYLCKLGFHLDELDYKTTLHDFIEYGLTNEEKAYLCAGLLQGTKTIYKQIVNIIEGRYKDDTL